MTRGTRWRVTTMVAGVALAGGESGCTQSSLFRENASSEAAAICSVTRSGEISPLRRSAAVGAMTLTFDALRARINARCQQCHLLTNTGGFRYTDAYAGTPERPGIGDASDEIADEIDSKRMPPNDPNPRDTQRLGTIFRAWLEAGKPMDSFRVPASNDVGEAGRLGLPDDMADAVTNLGGCIPEPDSVRGLMAVDVAKDDLFANATEIPVNLSDTDLTTFDTAKLATKGVFAFVPTYQLWSDDAHKVRMVRVPKGQKITYDRTTKKFHIPPNTRFYKTFFKKVVEPDGHVGFRAIETRLIVSRPAENGVDRAIFGTYLWNETETQATLWTGTYRDGTTFSDLLLPYTDAFSNCKTDENGKLSCDAHQHTYAIPARHRCIQCHQGAEGQNFVLGFTPLQINRRRPGEGGVIDQVGDDELTQVERLIQYGVLEDFGGPEALPKLELTGGVRRPRNAHELNAQAYMVGNCAHCHNPNGFPVRDEPKLRPFDLSPGGIVFQFPLGMQTVSTPTANYVSPSHTFDLTNDASVSLIFRRVATRVTSVWSDPIGQTHLVVPHMPANTPGMDCRAPDLLGRWIVSIPEYPLNPTPEQIARADRDAADRVSAFSSGCHGVDDVDNWVVEDFTEPEEYVPRRFDWNEWDPAEDPIDPHVHPELIHGMPKVFRELVVTEEETARIANTAVPYGYWTWKPNCAYPSTLPANPADPNDRDFYRRPWMLTSSGQPRRPLGEVFLATPGVAIFRAVCSNCHGARADGNSGNAKALAQLSQGDIRVANLHDGLFGPQNDAARLPGSNLSVFTEPGPAGMSLGTYGAAKYLVWMISGGTTVRFPAGFEALLGRDDRQFGGNMGTKVAYLCSRLLPTQFQQGALSNDEFEVAIPPEKRELWAAFCGFNNPFPTDPNNLPPGFTLEKWLRTAQYNGGLMMYFFFRDQAGQHGLPPNADQCERAFTAPGSP